MPTPGKLTAPISYYGSKKKVAPIIWQGFGKLTNYIEPFAGSLAVLLGNPQPAKIETVNDIDARLANFWRAVSIEPDAVAKIADYPLNETDMHARHKWMVSPATDDFRFKMNTDPNFYDVKMAGWWVWGMGASIPGNWLRTQGINSMPCLSAGGGGIHGLSQNIDQWFAKLQTRLRRVRVCCGDWQKVLSPSLTYKNKGLVASDMTGVFLDPPYSFKGGSRTKKVYVQDDDITSQVAEWAKINGDNPKMRVILCGYEGDYNLPDYTQVQWKTSGGMSNQAIGDSQGKSNAKREVIWLSKNCLPIKDPNE